ncbi:YrhB domain-containing protein [Streptomyces sp. NPDC127068]|uniref:YrhB domain-containing protein n=1 Tax=Streptomyces sp. NPDC127068 TaxID=3347127 RepID=UPI003653703A
MNAVDPSGAARHWLHRTYGDLVELAAPHPVAQDARTWMFSCRTVPQPGYPSTPMLASSVVVPKDGGEPFHPASDDPFGDAAGYPGPPQAQQPAARARRLNARGCVVTVAAQVTGGAPSTPLPWQPVHEAPGWWNLLLRRYFPGAEALRCADWDEVVRRAKEPGPGTRGVVWVRRETGGAEASGHLLYVLNDGGNVVFLDGMTGGLGRLDTLGVRELTFARVRPAGSGAAPAPDFGAARRKAEEWVRASWSEPVELVAPDPADETARGWLFACDTTSSLRTGDWRESMVDAAVVVPKDAEEPFLLPNSDPWGHFATWDRGGPAGTVPQPGRAAWFVPTLAELGGVLAVTEHATATEAVASLTALPPGGRALVWVRRLDGRGRPSTGVLLTGFRTAEGAVGLVDGSARTFSGLEGLRECGVRVIRYR